MPQPLTIISYPGNYRVQKSLVAAAYNDVKINLPAFEFGKDNVTAEFKSKFPLGKVPVMETPDGPIFESNAMAKYVAGIRADTNLLGGSLYEQAVVAQWVDFVSNEIDPPRGIWIYPILGYLKYDEKNYNEAKKDMTRALSAMNEHLLCHTYLAGNHITLADIVAGVTLAELFAKFFDPKFLSAVPNVVRWYTTVANQPEFVKVLGKPVFATSEQKYGQSAASVASPKTAPKAEKPKAEAKPAAAKPAPAADDYDDEAPAPKKKHPLEDLPASPMILDVMKKLAFSERPIKQSFFEELWPQFDAAGYSWWLCDYKYNDENKVYFMTGNAVGGFLQRCDAARKWSMGVMNVSGNDDEETGPFIISGAWLWRGQDFLIDMKEENPDSEYYDWVKVDISKPEGKQAIKDRFLADKYKGQTVLDRRYFK